jgi:hypothetical protein
MLTVLEPVKASEIAPTFRLHKRNGIPSKPKVYTDALAETNATKLCQMKH